jgi:hypothetical protein
MSTHVYNAYKFEGNLDALMKHLKSYRQKWIEYQKNRLLNIVISLHGSGELGDIAEDGKLSYRKLQNTISNQSGAGMKTCFDYFDVSGEVAIFSYRKELFVQTFLNDRLAPKFINRKFKDFHYQDQADPWFDFAFSEGKITKKQRNAAQKEWKIRENTWKNIFNNWNMTPAEAGMVYTLCSGMDFHNMAYYIWQAFKEKKLL